MTGDRQVQYPLRFTHFLGDMDKIWAAKETNQALWHSMTIRPRLASSLQIASRGIWIGWSPPAKEKLVKAMTMRLQELNRLWRRYRAVENHWNSRMAQTQMQKNDCTHKATSTKHQSATHCFDTSWTSSYPESIRQITMTMVYQPMYVPLMLLAWQRCVSVRRWQTDLFNWVIHDSCHHL